MAKVVLDIVICSLHIICMEEKTIAISSGVFQACGFCAEYFQELLRAGGYALVSIDEEPIGSGCIAQVHRAVIAPRTTADGTADALEQQQQRAVAVKIVHPGPDLTAPECSPLRPNHCPHLPPTALSSAAGCP